MLLALFYWLFLALAGTYILRNGAGVECKLFLLIAAGSIASAAAVHAGSLHFRGIDYLLLAIDVALLVLFVAIALRSDRYWPMWAAAFHGIGVATHLAVMAKPSIVPAAYAIAQGFWAYPMVLSIVIGVRAQRRIAHRTAVLR